MENPANHTNAKQLSTLRGFSSQDQHVIILQLTSNQLVARGSFVVDHVTQHSSALANYHLLEI